MNINKYYTLSIGLILLVFSDIYAQQDPQYTQYMYNTQVINPAYTSANDGLSFGLLTRTQWVGFDGAPKTSTFTVSNPFWIKEKMGIGLSIVHDKIGPAIQGNYTIDYAYTFYNDYKSKITPPLFSGEMENIDFSCSFEQMQDLLAVVRDATKQVDRMLSSADTGPKKSS